MAGVPSARAFKFPFLTVQVDGNAFTLSESWAGGYATLVDGTVHVDGVAVR